MQNSYKKHLLLEQLEDRIFLDANPVAAGADVVTDPATDQVDLPAPADGADMVVDPGAAQPVAEPMDQVSDSMAAEAADDSPDPAADADSGTVTADNGEPQTATAAADPDTPDS